MRGSKETGFFHVCTDGKALPWMFKDDKDFVAGINRIGVCHLKTKVIVIAFILMDNHVHFILHGIMPDCKKFINLYKRLTGKWISIRHGIKDHIKTTPTDIIRIADEESLLKTIAYIDRNSIMAGYRHMPGEYPWGSARHIFRSREEIKGTFRQIGTLTYREKRAILCTHTPVPAEWRIDENGMLDMTCFINFNRLESYFKSASRYSFFLAKKLEGTIEMGLENSQKTFIPDKELRLIVSKLALQSYGDNDIRNLDVNTRLSLARKLRYNYASTLKQIARMVHLDKEILEGFI